MLSPNPAERPTVNDILGSNLMQNWVRAPRNAIQKKKTVVKKIVFDVNKMVKPSHDSFKPKRKSLIN